jgi:glucose/mannose transport system substrate-binding protein
LVLVTTYIHENGEGKMSSNKRFSILLSLSIVLVLLLVACQPAAPAPEEPAAPAEEPAAEEPAAEEEAAEPAPAESALTPEGAADGKLEVFSWWTSGGEAAALDALFEAYSASNPDVEIINATVAGGGGSAARGVLQTRLAGGDPPDTWQVHPGFELLGQYVDG